MFNALIFPGIKWKSLKTLMIAFALGVWILGMGVGWSVLFNYENSSGISAAAPSVWPEQSSFTPLSGLPALVMMVHPKCPCTRASIQELEYIMARFNGKVSAYVLFIKPENAGNDWTKTDSWKKAERIPGVKVMEDEFGRSAKLFSAQTSGQTFLYDGKGNLIFSGGITEFRGHIGDSAGKSSIETFLLEGKRGAKETPVFGCSLFDAADGKQENQK